jgi:hypothetical protein
MFAKLAFSVFLLASLAAAQNHPEVHCNTGKKSPGTSNIALAADELARKGGICRQNGGGSQMVHGCMLSRPSPVTIRYLFLSWLTVVSKQLESESS